MKAQKLDRTFMLGLSIYLDQAQLSIDRAKWPDFKNYAKSMVSIDTVLNEVESRFSFNRKIVDALELPKLGLIQRFFRKKNHLYEIEEDYVYTCVFRLAEYLELKETPSIDKLLALRLNLAQAAGIIRDQVSNYGGEGVRIEHLNQNEIHKTKSIEEILGGPWL